MPRKVLVLPSRKPRSLPPVTCTIGGLRFGELAPSTVFAARAVAGSITMPAGAPPNNVRRSIKLDSDDGCDSRLLMRLLLRRQFYIDYWAAGRGSGARGLELYFSQNFSFASSPATDVGAVLSPSSIVKPGFSLTAGHLAKPFPFGSPVATKFAQ